jgi:two-component system, OmpR family, KDP operon response regulator KdpE
MTKRILLVDEDEPVRAMIGRVLESAGYQVLGARNAREAMQLIELADPDLLLIECPQAGAESVLDRLQRREPGVPVIATTRVPNGCEQWVQRGINALMDKPLDLPLLLDTVSVLLEESERKLRRAC